MDDKLPFLNIEFTFSQEQDSCSNDKDDQKLIISTDDAGGGNFYILKTERWAFNEIDDLIDLLKKFKNKFNKTIKEIEDGAL